MTHRRSVCGWLLGVFIIAVVGIVVVPTQTSGAMDRDEKVTRKGEVTQNDLNFQLNMVLHELDDMKQQLNSLLVFMSRRLTPRHENGLFSEQVRIPRVPE